MIGALHYEEYLKKCFPKDKINITTVTKDYLSPTIRVMVNGDTWFNIDGYNNFCGGVFLWGLEGDDLSKVLPHLEKTFDFCHISHQGLVTYITKKKGQEEVVEMLETMDFKPNFEVYNPNSGNVCIHWSLDLNVRRDKQNDK